jgi:hypothetical protein
MREVARRKAQERLRKDFWNILPKELDDKIRASFNILLPVEVMKVGGYPSQIVSDKE